MKRAWVGAALLSLCVSCGQEHEPADWVLMNGAVYTVDENRSWAEAVAIRNGRFVYVGDDDGVAGFRGAATEVIDLDGKMVLPGFFDSHAHPEYAHVEGISVSLAGLKTEQAYLAAVDAFAADNPERAVIVGGGWSNTVFPPGGPSKEALDRVVSDRPVILDSEDGHSTWVNSRTLELAAITRETTDPEGGVIERDRDTGEPRGTLRETAGDLVDDIKPPPTIDERIRALETFQEMAAGYGITSVRDAYLVDDVALEAYERSDLTMRFRANLRLDPDDSPDILDEFASTRESHRSPRFTIDGVKLFIDGVVEGETAFLLEPYAHRPDYRGKPRWTMEHLNDVVARADALGFMVHMHAIGDAAVRQALDAIEHAREVNGVRDSRHQITHLQLVAPSDIQRFAELDVVAVPQPFWFTKGDYYANLEKPYLGEERANHEYPMKSFFQAGAVVASSSDFDVTDPFRPLDGIEHGVLRSDDPTNPELTLGPEESVSLEDMIASFTINGAFANFMEAETGSIEVGKLADLVVLERNLFEIPPENIGETKLLMTLVAGEPVFRTDGF